VGFPINSLSIFCLIGIFLIFLKFLIVLEGNWFSEVNNCTKKKQIAFSNEKEYLNEIFWDEYIIRCDVFLE
jgi:hypothetical protein